MNKFILALILMTTNIAYAQSFKVEISSDSILLGNYFEIRYTIENSNGKFEEPEFDNMQIVSGPNYSSSVQIINNETSSKKSISYFLKPMELGSNYIPPAYLMDNEQNMETNVLEINVYPNPEGIIENSQFSESFSFDSFSWQKTSPPKELKKENKPKSKSKQKQRKL